MDLLSPSATQTYCPYKGTATYWTARIGGVVLDDIAWSYEEPLPESTPLRALLELRRPQDHRRRRPPGRGLSDAPWASENGYR